MNRKQTYIIAEAGVNHNGSVELALQLVYEAKKSGADCVKFQTFKAGRIVTQTSPKAAYQLNVTDRNESQYQMLKQLELELDSYYKIIAECKKLGIDFLSTPYNIEDIDFLEMLGSTGYKIASGQLTEDGFLTYAANKKKKIIISTGMASMEEVFHAVETIRATDNNDIVVLQCTTNYPSDIEDANIMAMVAIKEACKVKVGYSDHVVNNYACFAAVSLGAEIIEKHFTLDKNFPGPDHSTSLTPPEFAELVNGIRCIENALGDGIKRPTDKEKENIYGMKRSLVVIEDMTVGTILEAKHVGYKRPMNGLHPNMISKILGKKLAKDLKKDEPINFDSIVW
jgi:N-acetylneuraminate synthase/N,N'-diacetyllegionaminate synthase